jgi:hypothetical protein
MLGNPGVRVRVRVTSSIQVAPKNTPTMKAESSTIMMKQIGMKVEGCLLGFWFSEQAPHPGESRREFWIRTMMSGR